MKLLNLNLVSLKLIRIIISKIIFCIPREEIYFKYQKKKVEEKHYCSQTELLYFKKVNQNKYQTGNCKHPDYHT